MHDNSRQGKHDRYLHVGLYVCRLVVAAHAMQNSTYSQPYTNMLPRFSRHRTREHAVVAHAGGERDLQRELLHAVPLLVAASHNGGHLDECG